MSIRTHYLRWAKYLKLHGFRSSLKRTWREMKNSYIYNREVIYWRDLLREDLVSHCLPENHSVERYDSEDKIPESLFKRMVELYSEELLHVTIRPRFEKGAHMWCLKNGTEEIGFLWSLEGKTMKPYCFPLLPRDVYFLDGLIFPSCRGQGQFPILMDHILNYYSKQGYHRAHLKIDEWNSSSMNSVTKNGFIRIGLARMRCHRGKLGVMWWHD